VCGSKQHVVGFAFFDCIEICIDSHGIEALLATHGHNPSEREKIVWIGGELNGGGDGSN